MPRTERIYRRTEAGLKACESRNSGLPDGYRSILQLLETDAHSSLIRAHLRRYPEKQVWDWLDELQTLGLVKSQPATSTHDLDFTSSLDVAELLTPQKAR